MASDFNGGNFDFLLHQDNIYLPIYLNKTDCVSALVFNYLFLKNLCIDYISYTSKSTVRGFKVSIDLKYMY